MNRQPEVHPIPPEASLLLSWIHTVPGLPQIVDELRATLQDPMSDARRVAAVLSKDPGLTARTLKLANSPAYGFSGKITTVPLACSLIGYRTLGEIAETTAVLTILCQGEKKFFDPLGFWAHSVHAGLCARILNQTLGYGLRNDVFTCGLLHDLGKVAVRHFAPDLYASVVKLARGGVPYRDAERQVLRADHAMIGYWIGAQWKFPAHFNECLRRHHDIPPTAATQLDQQVTLTALGNLLAHAIEAKIREAKPPSLPPDLERRYGLDKAACGEIARSAMRECKAMLPQLAP